MKTQATRAMKLVKLSTVVRVMVIFACCLFLTQTSFAQNINTMGYASVDFDAENNIVYGYAFTEPGYSAGVYYNQTYVGATIYDANNNVVAAVPNHTAYGRAVISFQGPGTGHPPYTIKSGHMLFMTYYVSNYWDPYTYQYKSGWLDNYYYSFYTPGGAGFPTLAELFFNFLGRSPYSVSSSINLFIGNLLSEFFPSSLESIRYKTAKVDSTTRNFNTLNNAELPLNETAGGSSYCFGGGSNPFTLVLDFELPPQTSDVFQDSRSFISENINTDQYQGLSLQFSNINLSGVPKTGRVSIRAIRKRPSSSFPNNRVRVTVSGRISGGETFATTGRVRLTCP